MLILFSKSVLRCWKLIWWVKNVPELRLRKLHVLDKLRRCYTHRHLLRKQTPKTDLWNRFIEYTQIISPTQMFSSEFWEIFENIFFHRTPPVVASVLKFFQNLLEYFESIKFCKNKLLGYLFLRFGLSKLPNKRTLNNPTTNTTTTTIDFEKCNKHPVTHLWWSFLRK